MASKTLSTNDQEIAHTTVTMYRKYELLCEHHASILRSDPNSYAKAYELYQSMSSEKPGFIPPMKEENEYRVKAEDLAGKECTTPIEFVPFSLSFLFMRHMTPTPP